MNPTPVRTLSVLAKRKWPSHFLLLCIIVCTFSISSCSSSNASKSKSKDGYQYVFDGKSLEGWTYDPVYWRVEDGSLVGEITPATLLKTNSFIYKKDLVAGDFDLRVEYRISAKGNSGINYRSEVIDTLPYALRGYQADIDGQNRYTGQNYEERKRTTLAYRGQRVVVEAVSDALPLKDHISKNAWVPAKVIDSLGTTNSLLQAIKNEDWNEYHLVVEGNRMQHYVNGVLMSDVTDNDAVNRKMSGLIGVQVHVGPPMKVEYRNFRIKEL